MYNSRAMKTVPIGRLAGKETPLLTIAVSTITLVDSIAENVKHRSGVRPIVCPFVRLCAPLAYIRSDSTKAAPTRQEYVSTL